MQLVDAHGNNLWATDGILISDNPQMTWLTEWDMTADNANHAILTWQDIRNGGNNNVVAYRISPTGSFVWGEDGIALSNSAAFNVSPKVTVTSAGNAVFAWQADDAIIMQKVSPTGSVLWGANGISIIPVSGVQTYIVDARKSPADMVVFYEEYVDNVNIVLKASRIDTDGNFVWPSGIVDISTVVSSKVHPVVNEFADNQWILSWEDDRNGNSDIYAQNVQLDGSLGPYDPQEGTIEGMVALIGGTASVTQVEVMAGEIMTHPDATGFYSMVVPSGTYAVTGNLGGYLPDTVQGVVVVTGQTTLDVV